MRTYDRSRGSQLRSIKRARHFQLYLRACTENRQHAVGPLFSVARQLTFSICRTAVRASVQLVRVRRPRSCLLQYDDDDLGLISPSSIMSDVPRRYSTLLRGGDGARFSQVLHRTHKLRDELAASERKIPIREEGAHTQHGGPNTTLANHAAHGWRILFSDRAV